MASIQKRVDQLEAQRDRKANVYELTDAQLLESIGLPGDASDAEIDAYFQRRYGRSLIYPDPSSDLVARLMAGAKPADRG